MYVPRRRIYKSRVPSSMEGDLLREGKKLYNPTLLVWGGQSPGMDGVDIYTIQL